MQVLRNGWFVLILAAGCSGAVVEAGADAAPGASDAGDPEDAGELLDAGEPEDGGTSMDWREACPSRGRLLDAVAVATPSEDGVSVVLRVTLSGQPYAKLLLFDGERAALASLPRIRRIACASGEVCAPEDTATGPFGNAFTPISGQIALERVSSPLSSEVRVTFTDLVFALTREVCEETDAGEQCRAALDPGKVCPAISFTLDTARLGAPCLDVADCGTNGLACSLTTHACVKSTCATDADCGAGKTCMGQRAPGWPDDGSPSTTCYGRCDPRVANTCAAGFGCVRRWQGDWSVGDGACLPLGTGAAGATCNPFAGTNSTGCLEGLVCVGQVDPQGFQTGQRVCSKGCDWFAAHPGCATSERCAQDLCVPARSGAGIDPAAMDQPCAQHHGGWWCADDGETWRGACSTRNDPEKPVCRPRCETGSTCAIGSCTYDHVCE